MFVSFYYSNLRDNPKNCILMLILPTRKNCRNCRNSLRPISLHPIFFFISFFHLCLYYLDTLLLLYFMDKFSLYHNNTENDWINVFDSTYSMQRWIRGPILVVKALVRLLFWNYNLFFSFFNKVKVCYQYASLVLYVIIE